MQKPFGTVSALSLSYYILSYVPSSQLKLQKLVYYSEGWHLAYFEQSIIPEDFEAWVHGPAIRELWDHYKGRGTMLTEYYIKPERIDKIRSYFNHVLNPQQIEMLNDVIKEYGDKSAYHLEALTHGEKPWKEARKGYSHSQRSEVVISKKTMKTFYQELLAQ